MLVTKAHKAVLQNNLVQHMLELQKGINLRYEEKIKHHEAMIGLGKGLIVLAVGLIIDAVVRWR